MWCLVHAHSNEYRVRCCLAHFLGQQSSLVSSTLSLSIISSQNCRKTMLGLSVGGSVVRQWGFHIAGDAPPNKLVLPLRLFFFAFSFNLCASNMLCRHAMSFCCTFCQSNYCRHFDFFSSDPRKQGVHTRMMRAMHQNDTISDFSHYPTLSLIQGSKSYAS